MRLLTFLALTLTLLIPTVSQADEKAELKKLQGDYRITKLSRKGMDAPADALKSKLNIKDNVFTMISPRDDGEKREPINAKLDDTKTPKHVTLIKDGKPRLEGIYKLEGNKLTFCFNQAGKGRPTKFESNANVDWMLMVCERKKK